MDAMRARRRQRETMTLMEVPTGEEGTTDLEEGGDQVRDDASKDDVLIEPGRPRGSARALMRSPKPGGDQVQDDA